MIYPKFSKSALIFVTATALLFNCTKKKEDEPTPVPVVVPPAEVKSTTYQLDAKELGNSGTAVFTEKSGGQTIVDLNIKNISVGSGPYLAHIHIKSAAETGDPVYLLTPVNDKGQSSTVINVAYSELINYDGYINVHKNATSLLSQGDIGGNVLTGDKKEYTIAEANTSGVGSGILLLQKRKNGNTLATLTFPGAISTDSYPIKIRNGNIGAIEGELLLKLQNNVDGYSKMAKNTIRTLKGVSANYDALLNQTMYLEVYKSSIGLDSTKVIARANIGKN
ncbi:MAG: CHRD domain-containing protein [Opitutaceae bacterium]|nr:CHRD domain-containing protein [Cytophagales bacterium]